MHESAAIRRAILVPRAVAYAATRHNRDGSNARLMHAVADAFEVPPIGNFFARDVGSNGFRDQL
jgi:hypothetical protein